MKQSQQSGLWHRCGTCGTVFMSIQELSRHMATHKTKSSAPRRRALPSREPVTIVPAIQPDNSPNLPSDHV